ncbi:LysR family transcriptional regulator [Streptomyces olivaceus]|uniref:LysR family transcriptional regulator n=1 Tax=Streptomyces olivaceus TaxID=47716 RepID=UPI0008791B34|nr:LysR family transcriptional regulator [Streptomyces olivaceus]AOW90287.1 LysR family transcriptional regulator [Streptomyces olivaceus]MBZ6191896.1 LysR family transcriptional regulator [Streptomyces olivaceus]MBZ6284337.1 LysR family transcriptional regulator [Streptomyces olivaceus]GHI98640.1 LysR family transcriptional regulator [Streptomyces olivaceus]
MPDVPPTPVDLDLRLVHCFTIVAEHRHFGRAADVMHTTQPSLSRQIRRLERHMGVRLLDRSPRGTELTEAGETFLPLARELLDAAVRAVTHTQATVLPRKITVGYTTNLIVTPAVGELRRRCPDVEVHAVHLPWNTPREALLDHRVDAVVTRMPLRTKGLHVTVLHEEPRALVVPLGHRLAGLSSVTLDDIADEPLPRMSDPDWNAYWRIDPRPDGRSAPDGPLIENIEDKIEHIAAGQAIAIVPAGEYLNRLRPGLTTVALKGVTPVHVVLATRADDRSRLVTTFRQLAEHHLARPSREL